MWKSTLRLIEVIRVKFLDSIKGGYFGDGNASKHNGGHFA